MRRFFVGQWLDVKDTVNNWLEATVMDMANSGEIRVGIWRVFAYSKNCFETCTSSDSDKCLLMLDVQFDPPSTTAAPNLTLF